jgi:hypothetical protein
MSSRIRSKTSIAAIVRSVLSRILPMMASCLHIEQRITSSFVELLNTAGEGMDLQLARCAEVMTSSDNLDVSCTQHILHSLASQMC